MSSGEKNRIQGLGGGDSISGDWVDPRPQMSCQKLVDEDKLVRLHQDSSKILGLLGLKSSIIPFPETGTNLDVLHDELEQIQVEVFKLQAAHGVVTKLLRADAMKGVTTDLEEEEEDWVIPNDKNGTGGGATAGGASPTEPCFKKEVKEEVATLITGSAQGSEVDDYIKDEEEEEEEDIGGLTTAQEDQRILYQLSVLRELVPLDQGKSLEGKTLPELSKGIPTNPSLVISVANYMDVALEQPAIFHELDFKSALDWSSTAGLARNLYDDARMFGLAGNIPSSDSVAASAPNLATNASTAGQTANSATGSLMTGLAGNMAMGGSRARQTENLTTIPSMAGPPGNFDFYTDACKAGLDGNLYSDACLLGLAGSIHTRASGAAPAAKLVTNASMAEQAGNSATNPSMAGQTETPAKGASMAGHAANLASSPSMAGPRGNFYTDACMLGLGENIHTCASMAGQAANLTPNPLMAGPPGNFNSNVDGCMLGLARNASSSALMAAEVTANMINNFSRSLVAANLAYSASREGHAASYYLPPPPPPPPPIFFPKPMDLPNHSNPGVPGFGASLTIGNVIEIQPRMTDVVRVQSRTPRQLTTKISGILGYKIPNTDRKLFINFEVLQSGATYIGLSLGPDHLAVGEDARRYIWYQTGYNTFRPDTRRNGKKGLAGQLVVSNENLCAWGEISGGAKATLKVAIWSQDAVNRLVRNLKPKLNDVARFIGPVRKPFACKLVLDNLLKIDLLEDDLMLKSGMTQGDISSVLRPSETESLLVSGSKSAEGLLLYKIGRTDIKLALAFWVLPTNSSFAISFVRAESACNYKLLTSLSTNQKNWTRSSFKLASPSDGEVQIQIRNLVAKAVMLNAHGALNLSCHSLLKVSIQAQKPLTTE